MTRSHTDHHIVDVMGNTVRMTVTIPDEIGAAVKRRTGNVSAYVAEALAEKLHRERREEARRQLLDLAGTAEVAEDVHEVLQEERRADDRA